MPTDKNKVHECYRTPQFRGVLHYVTIVTGITYLGYVAVALANAALNARQIFSIDINFANWFLTENSIGSAVYQQLIVSLFNSISSQLISFVVLLILFSALLHPFQKCALSVKTFGTKIVFLIVGFLLSFASYYVLGSYLPLPDNLHVIANANVVSPIALILFAIQIFLFAPILEELLFRELPFHQSFNLGTLGVTIVPTFLFAALHYSEGGLLRVAYVLPLGFFLIATRLATGSVLYSIAAHMGFNIAPLFFH
jgi:membrane protease YdiL (CAAX protease family)